jgi:hypothetical protein
VSVVTFSDKRWPLVHLQWPTFHDASHIQSVVIALKALLARQEPFVLIADLRDAPTVTNAQLDHLQRFIEAQRDALTALCKGNALVVNSLAMRSMLTHLIEQLALPIPFRAVANMDDAEGWCWAQIEEARREARRRRSSV